MNTNGIKLPENLFGAIDKIHAQATAIYNGIDPEAMKLVSSTRDKVEINKTTANIKNKNLPKP